MGDCIPWARTDLLSVSLPRKWFSFVRTINFRVEEIVKSCWTCWSLVSDCFKVQQLKFKTKQWFNINRNSKPDIFTWTARSCPVWWLTPRFEFHTNIQCSSIISLGNINIRNHFWRNTSNARSKSVELKLSLSCANTCPRTWFFDRSLSFFNNLLVNSVI